MTIKTRLAVSYTGTVAGILLLMSYFIYFFSERHLYEKLSEGLEKNAMLLGMATLNPNPYSDTLYYQVKEAHFQKLPEEHDYIFRNIKESSSIKFDQNLHLPPGFFSKAILQGKARYSDGNTSYVAIFFKDKVHSEDILVVSHASAIDVINELSDLRTTLLLGFILFVFLSFPVSIWFFMYTLKPIKEIIRSVDNIHSSNLNQRLKTDGKKHEFTELNNTFNSLLDRMEVFFNNQQGFISNVSHSFRTPLTIIIGETELAMADLKAGKYKETLESLQVIHHRSIYLKEIINGLLGLIRSSGISEMEQWETVRIDEVLDQAVETARHTYSKNSFKLNIQACTEDDAKIQVFGHKNLLTLAMFNIINNACKYSDNKTVDITLGAEEGKIIVTISDNGIGIPEEELSKIFKPFFRASNVGGLEGAGIGLPLTYNILRMHNAQISITSQLQEGSQVRIVLPSILEKKTNKLYRKQMFREQ
jgi:signal transduction histidine kinase